MCFRNKFLLFMGMVCICSAVENPRLRRREMHSQVNLSSHNVQTPNEMMAQIHDRVSALATLDQSQRNKLDDIENKLTQLDASTYARLESIRVQQQEAAKQLESLEYMQRNVQSTVGEIRNELDVVRYSMDQQKDLAPSHVHARQINGDSDDPNDISKKLDSLAIFLTSTRASIARIENAINEYGASLTRLTQLTRGAHKRLSILSRHQNNNGGPQAQPQYPQIFNTHQTSIFGSEPNSCGQASLSETSLQKIQVYPQGTPFYALCESAEKGGWTVIQNRFDGFINFNRNWDEYKRGFGNLAGEFFIGLDKLHALTSATLNELMIVMVDFKNETRVAKYSAFAIAGEADFYALEILGQYSGTAGDSLSYQAGQKFSTFDNDNDGWVEGNCAQSHTGAWWYGACETSNLNGQYLEGEVDETQQFQGMYWKDFNGPLYSLKSVQMKIRPTEPKEVF